MIFSAQNSYKNSKHLFHLAPHANRAKTKEKYLEKNKHHLPTTIAPQFLYKNILQLKYKTKDRFEIVLMAFNLR